MTTTDAAVSFALPHPAESCSAPGCSCSKRSRPASRLDPRSPVLADAERAETRRLIGGVGRGGDARGRTSSLWRAPCVG